MITERPSGVRSAVGNLRFSIALRGGGGQECPLYHKTEAREVQRIRARRNPPRGFGDNDCKVVRVISTGDPTKCFFSATLLLYTKAVVSCSQSVAKNPDLVQLCAVAPSPALSRACVDYPRPASPRRAPRPAPRLLAFLFFCGGSRRVAGSVRAVLRQFSVVAKRRSVSLLLFPPCGRFARLCSALSPAPLRLSLRARRSPLAPLAPRSALCCDYHY